MYLPKHFENKDFSEISRLILEYPLATLVCNVDGEIFANHIPLIMESANELIGHIAKSNPMHEIIQNNVKILAIFNGENSYISPNYYPTKLETHRHVPTWNYQAVHIHGKIIFTHTKKDRLAVVGKMTKFFEHKLFGNKAWKMSDAPKDFMEDKIENIVAFKIDIENISAKSKLSQNKEKVDFDNVKKIMNEIGKTDLSKAIKPQSKVK